VVDYDNGAVDVLLGKGDGTFQSEVAYPTGSAPFAVAVGDFNGDGRLDLAVANGCTNCPFGGSVSILLGNGNGTFQTHVDYATGNNPGAITVGDFNEDGKLDLAVVNTSDSTVGVLLGNGDGTFQTQIAYPIAGTACCQGEIGVGDFNKDGNLDLVAAAGNGVSVLLGKGDGTFQAHVDYTGGGAAVGDLNRDGKLDLTGGASVLLGNGDGTFGSPISTGVAGGDVALGDFNSDGKLDMAVANNYDGSTISVLLGNGDGTFQTAVNYGTASYPTGVVVGDFNRDGRLDLAVAALDAVSVLLQTPIVRLSKTSLTFADQLVGTSSAAQTVTLSNTSGLTLQVNSIALTGTNAADFSQVHTCGSRLRPGAHCTISVSFTPTQTGPRTAAVTITDNAAGSPQNIELNGTGVVTGPNATPSPTSLTFATQLVGTTSATQPVTLTNYGTMALNITSIVASGDFSQTNTCGSSLAAGASCTINVTFTPTQIGTRTGAVSITDNAPGSPQKVSLTGTGTVVEFNPASLNFGNVVKFQSRTLTTTLTNTSKTTLTITGITIVGGPFSQTNNCGSSVAGGKSCTISVTFKPTGIGTFNSAVSISDNGGGSPQQVPLTGVGTRSQLSQRARSVLATTQAANVPSPTGPSSIGTRVIDFVDSARNDPFLANGTKRELLLRFWYPASLNRDCEPAQYTSTKVWSYFSQLVALPLPEVTTNSCLDAPMSEGVHPVVVFTHGYTATFTDYTFIFEDLASRGYVVASVDHTYEATAVEFPDGRFVKSLLGSHLAKDTLRGDRQTLSRAVSVRLDDIKSVLDKLGRLNAENDSPFAGKLDTSHIAIAGHSLGAATALLSVEKETRLRAAVIIDGWPDSLAMSTKTPVLILAAGHEQWSDVEQRLWDQLSGPRIAVNLKGTEHVTPTDAIWLAKGAVKTGSMGPEKTIAALRDYIAAFLDTHLRNKPFNPLLNGPLSAYPDAEVTTQKELLSSKAMDH
jgi:dienelactone hydrolase